MFCTDVATHWMTKKVLKMKRVIRGMILHRMFQLVTVLNFISLERINPPWPCMGHSLWPIVDGDKLIEFHYLITARAFY